MPAVSGEPTPHLSARLRPRRRRAGRARRGAHGGTADRALPARPARGATTRLDHVPELLPGARSHRAERRHRAGHPLRSRRHVPVGEEPSHAVPPVGQRRPARGPAGRPHLPHEPAGPAPDRRLPGPALRRRADSRPPAGRRPGALRRERGAPGGLSRPAGRALRRGRGAPDPRRRRHARGEEARAVSDARRRPPSSPCRGADPILAARRGRGRTGPVGGRGGVLGPSPWPRHVPRVARARGPAHRLSGEPTSSPSPAASTSSISRPPPRASRSSRAPGRDRIPWSPPAARS